MPRMPCREQPLVITRASNPGADVLHSTYTVIEVLRWVMLAHAAALCLQRRDEAAHPWLMVAALVLMAVWTPFVGRMQDDPSGRQPWLMWSDLGLSVALLASSRLVLGGAAMSLDAMPLPGFWVLAAPLAVAVWAGARSGLAAGALLGVVHLVMGRTIDVRTVGIIAGLLVLSWGLGRIVDTLRASIADREADYARAAALAERDRMNRIVHDGALQVLAMVEREGPELGPKGVYLANVARQQESRLRALLQDRNVDLPEEMPDNQGTDITTMLEQHDSDTVTVSLMAGEVMMDRRRAQELDAAVREVIANVEKHAGPSARAWVLVEEEDGQVIVSVRDNGHGMTRQQVDRAMSSGRLGIQNSILGRIADIGGVAIARSLPGRGVEWEFRVPTQEER